VYLSVGDDQENVVEGFVLSGSNLLSHGVKYVGEVSGATERDLTEVLSIDLLNADSADHFWVGEVSIERERMGDLVTAHETRNTSETVDWEAPIVIIDL
jgi:hypothetical protein